MEVTISESDAEACRLIADILFNQAKHPQGIEVLNHAIQYLVHREHYIDLKAKRLAKFWAHTTLSACA